MMLNIKRAAILFIAFLFSSYGSGLAQRIDRWTQPSQVNVFLDTAKPDSAVNKISLVAAKNEFEAAQIVVRSDKSFIIKGVSFTVLKNGTKTIDAKNLTYHFVEYEKLSSSTTFGANQPILNYTRKGPGYFPDGLSNESAIEVPANNTQPVWIKLYIPQNTIAGIYKGVITVKTNRGDFKTPFIVDVQNVTIPDPPDGQFTSAMWVQYYGPISWDGGPRNYGDLKHHYGWDVLTPGWWKLMEDYATVMHDYRSNDLPVNYHYMLIEGGSRLDTVTGKYTFNWSVFDKVIQFFIDHKAIKRLEGVFTAQRYHYSNRYLTQIIDNVDGVMVRSWVMPDDPKSLAWINQFYPALKKHLDTKGWTSMWWQHIADEPSSDLLRADYKYLATKIKAVWPTIKMGDAYFDRGYHALVGYNNLWIVNTQAYDPDQQFFNARQAAGDEVWTYTCNIPVGNYLNRFIDAPQWSMRLYMWNCYLHNITGYLHWGYNAWGYETPGTILEHAQKGDNYLVKPDIINNKLKTTIRYEAQRDGIEEYELLKILGAKNPEKAKSIAQTLISSNTIYTKDIKLMIRMHNALVKAAAAE